MKIGFDIGGVLSKYPNEFKKLLDILRLGRYDNFSRHLMYEDVDIFIITDQHPIDKVQQVLYENDLLSKHEPTGIFTFGRFSPENIYCADYEKYGNMAKAILIKELGLDIFIDDFDGYLQWDSSFGPQPILLKVQPDAYKPYWHPDWKCDGGDFGRRKYL